MRTTIPLSGDDRRTIQKINLRNRNKSDALIIIGGFIVFIGLFFLMGYLLGNTNNYSFLGIVMLTFITGGLFLLGGVFLNKRNRNIAEHSTQLHEKEAFTGSLLKIKNINNRKLRYQFNGFSVDVLPYLETSESYRINTVNALINREVTLHVVKIADDEIFLLKAFYEPQIPGKETLVPISKGDRRKMLSNPGNILAAVIFIAIFTIIFLIIGRDLSELRFMLIIPGVVICSFVIPWLIKIAASTRKLVLTTNITERIDIRIGSGKHARNQVWYRLGNGDIRNLDRSDLLLGEMVIITYFVKKDGTRGDLIAVDRIKA